MAKVVLQVWLTYPFTRVLMFANQSEYDPLDEIVPFVHATFGPDRLSFGGNLSTGYEGRPLIRSWFTEGFRLVKTGYLCFINGDIIITPLWMNTAMAVFDAFGSSLVYKTLIYGTRTDVHRRPIGIPRNSTDYVDRLVAWLGANERCNNPYGMDLVLVHSSFSLLWHELPDFVVGMCVWDNFFMAYANPRANTVTMDFGAKVYHVDHPPNACNDQNYEYFRMMALKSPHFAGFAEHSYARWTVQLESNRLAQGEETVLFNRTVDNVTRSAFG
jgi:hypothetical protein